MTFREFWREADAAERMFIIGGTMALFGLEGWMIWLFLS